MINLSNFYIIAHRGLTEGPSKDKENNINKIIENISLFPAILNEIDLHIMDSGIFVGHDNPQKKIDLNFLLSNKNNLVIHIKFIETNSLEALNIFQKLHLNCHIFSHENDIFSITNKGWIWSHPKEGFKDNTILVMPEKLIAFENPKFIEKIKTLKGVCTDFPLKMLDLIK